MVVDARGRPGRPGRVPAVPHPSAQAPLRVGRLAMDACAALCTASTPISCPCSSISPSRAASSGMARTVRHHPGGTPAIKATR